LHELSLVQGIIDAIEETAEERKGRVQSFKVEVGELAQFDIRLVRQLISDMKKGTMLEGAKVVVEKERSKVRCLSCGGRWAFEDLAGPLSGAEKEMVHFLPELLSSCSRCPSCSKSFFEIEEGRSVRVSEVVLDV
jgi:hydrogenase nickel incorporation protein HypA/HybF